MVDGETQPGGGSRPSGESPSTQEALGTAPGVTTEAGAVRGLEKQRAQAQPLPGIRAHSCSSWPEAEAGDHCTICTPWESKSCHPSRCCPSWDQVLGGFGQTLCAEAVLSLPGKSWSILPTITNLNAFSHLLVFRDWFQETKMPSLQTQTVLSRWSLKWKLNTSPLRWPSNIDPGSEQINECTFTIWMAKYFQLRALRTMQNMFALEGG